MLKHAGDLAREWRASEWRKNAPPFSPEAKFTLDPCLRVLHGVRRAATAPASAAGVKAQPPWQPKRQGRTPPPSPAGRRRACKRCFCAAACPPRRLPRAPPQLSTQHFQTEALKLASLLRLPVKAPRAQAAAAAAAPAGPSPPTAAVGGNVLLPQSLLESPLLALPPPALVGLTPLVDPGTGRLVMRPVPVYCPVSMPLLGADTEPLSPGGRMQCAGASNAAHATVAPALGAARAKAGKAGGGSTAASQRRRATAPL
jgi:hypothetical protein